MNNAAVELRPDPQRILRLLFGHVTVESEPRMDFCTCQAPLPITISPDHIARKVSTDQGELVQSRI
jgi:hypothetical protein